VAVTYIAQGTASTVASGNASPALPGALLTNDVLLCVVVSRDNVAHTLPAPWAQIVQGNSGTITRLSVWWRRCDGTETAPTVTHTAGSYCTARISQWRGCKTSGNPYCIASAAVTVDAATPISTPAVTTTSADCRILHVAGCGHSISGAQVYSAPSGTPTTATPGTTAGGTGTTRTAITIYAGTQAAAGTTGAAGLAYSRASSQASILLALEQSWDKSGTGTDLAGSAALSTADGFATLEPGAFVRSKGAALTSASRTNSTLAAPASRPDGDVLVAVLVAGAAASPTVTPPSGFTEVPGYPIHYGAADPWYVDVHVYTKIASGESGDYLFTHSAAGTEGLVYSVGGVDTGTPASPTPTKATGTGFTSTAPTITTARDGSLVLWVGACWDAAGPAVPPTGSTPTFTEDYDAGAGGIGYFASGVLAVAGATGNEAVTTSNLYSYSPWGAGLVCIQAAASGDTRSGTGQDLAGAAALGTATGTRAVSGTGVALAGAASLGAATGSRASAGTGADLAGAAALSTAAGFATVTGDTRSGTGLDLAGAAALSAATGSKAASGTAASLAAAAALGVATGSKSASGTASTLAGAAALSAAVGAKAASGTGVALAGAAALGTAAGSKSASGTAVTLSATAALGPASGSKAASGTGATLAGAAALSTADGSASAVEVRSGTGTDLAGAAALSGATGSKSASGTGASLAGAAALSIAQGHTSRSGAGIGLAASASLGIATGAKAASGTGQAFAGAAALSAGQGYAARSGTGQPLAGDAALSQGLGYSARSGTGADLAGAASLGLGEGKKGLPPGGGIELLAFRLGSRVLSLSRSSVYTVRRPARVLALLLPQSSYTIRRPDRALVLRRP
jgi:hypothetical protein